MRFGSRGPSEEVVSFSFTTKYNSLFFFALQIAHYPKTLGALFPFTQNVRFEFSAASCSEWNNSFQISKKEDNHARYTQVFVFFTGIVLSIQLCSPIFFRIFGWMVYISEIQQFPEFLETFLYYLPLFPNFWKVLLEWKATHVFNFLQILISLTSPKSPQLSFVVNNPRSWCIDTCSKKKNYYANQTVAPRHIQKLIASGT